MSIQIKNRCTFLFLFLPFLLTACLSTSARQAGVKTGIHREIVPNEIRWKELNGSADYFLYENRSVPLRYHCVRINLLSENLRITVFPKEESDFVYKNNERTQFFKGKSAEQFCAEAGANIAVNAAPFSGKKENSRLLTKISTVRKIKGIHISNGKKLSPEKEKYSAIVFSKNKSGAGFTGKIVQNQTEESISGCAFACGGFYTILSNGKKEQFNLETNDSRTALGLDADGKTLFILVAEGERKKTSKGLSFQDCAEIMLVLGADSALQMDGGSSSSLVIDGKNCLSYKPSIKQGSLIGFSFGEP